MKNFRIGPRTMKTAICAGIAICLANILGLSYPASAGIIAILSVANTKKSTLEIGVLRFIGLSIATLLSVVLFQFIPIDALAFSIFLILFIPISVATKTTDGIVINSVIATHYLLAPHITFSVVLNEVSLMLIGVGLALISNVYMPDDEKKLHDLIEIFEKEFKDIAAHIVIFLNNPLQEELLKQRTDELYNFSVESLKLARRYRENKLFRENDFYARYFQMRRAQVEILGNIVQKLSTLEIENTHVEAVSEIFQSLSIVFATDNDGQKLLQQIEDTYDLYRNSPLPTTRQEFENRAGLFQVLQLVELLVREKVTFVLSDTK